MLPVVRSALSFQSVVINDADIDFSSIEKDFRGDIPVDRIMDSRENTIPEGRVFGDNPIDYNPIPAIFGEEGHQNALEYVVSEAFEPIPLQELSRRTQPQQVVPDEEDDLPVEAFPDDASFPDQMEKGHHPSPQATAFSLISDVTRTGEITPTTNSETVEAVSHSSQVSYSDVSEKEIEDVLSDDSAYFENYDFSQNIKKFRDYQTDQWQRRYNELKQVFLVTGKSAVHHADTSKKCLARWIKRQRAQYKLRQEGKPSSMTDDRIDALNLINFVWDSHNTVWEDRVKELKEFRNKHKHCNVTPSNYPFGSTLISWVKSQRRQYRMMKDGKKSNLTPRRIEQLKALGFQF